MTLRRWFGLVSFLVLAVVACDDPPTEVQPYITGEVDLHDELGHRLATADLVRVSALSASSVRQYQTFTDAQGRFSVELPPDEMVPLLFTRDGFGDMFRYGVEDEPGPIQVDLFARSSAAVTSVSAVAEPCGGDSNCLRLALDVDDFFIAGSSRRLFRMYLSTDPSVSTYQYQLSDLLVVPNDQLGLMRDGASASFEVDWRHGDFAQFTSGETVYLLVYGATENLSNSYLSPAYDLEIFTDLSPDYATASVIIP